MDISYHIFLVAYIFSALFAALFFAVNFYHVIRYSFRTAIALAMTTFFCLGFILMIGVTAVFITGTDWQQIFTITIGF